MFSVTRGVLYSQNVASLYYCDKINLEGGCISIHPPRDNVVANVDTCDFHWFLYVDDQLKVWISIKIYNNCGHVIKLLIKRDFL